MTIPVSTTSISMVSQQINGNQIIYSINDSNGNLQTYTINLVAVQIATAFGSSAREYNQQRQTVSSIVLPNKQSYSFLYDSWGDITQLTLPTGATISYGWDTVTVGSSGNLVRAVTKRTVQHDGVSDVWNISFAPPTASGQSVTVTDPADSNGVSRQEIYTYDLSQHLSKIQYLSSASGQQLLQYDLTWDGLTSWTGENNLLTSIKTTLENSQVSLRTFEYDLYGYTHQQWNCVGEWATCAAMANGGTLNGVPFVPAPPTYLPPPTWFPGSHGNVTRIQEYDWGQGAPGPLVRQTIRTYLHDDPNSGYFIATQNATKPGATLRNIANRVTSETIYDGSVSCEGTGTWTDDGNGTITPAPQCKANQLSQTTVVYDYGDPATNGYYGEPTSISRWVNGPVPGSVTTSYVYDSHGNIKSVTDPRGGVTGYSYGDASVNSSACPGTSGSNAYVVTKTNALNQQENYSYYQCTGKLASYQDANDIASGRSGTQYGYDLMGRLSSVSYPDGGLTTTNYDDAARTVDVKQLIAAGKTREALTQLDNLGRAIQSQLLSDPQGTDYTDTTYDALGRVASVSNPYRSKSELTYGITSYSYDARGRKLLQCQPDNGNNTPCVAGSSYIQWQYNGNATIFTDEDGNSWTRTSDALGRLTNVVEPTTASTGYVYDALGNLSKVTQNGVSGDTPRTRSFIYDSLSRLITSTNPETGTICYGQWLGSNCVNGYDPNGNLLYKTDARNVTINYFYDALNRLTGKQYSGEADPTHPTLSTCYLYDADANSGTNTVGREVSEWTQSGNCPTSATGVSTAAVSWKNSLSYDPMGRVTNELQCAFSPCSAPSSLQYTYDLAGNLTGSNNGLTGAANSQSPQVGWTNGYDGAGRLSKVTSNWTEDATHPATLFEADSSIGQTAYGPIGLIAAEFGVNATNNTVGLLETRSYDNRERITNITAQGSQGPAPQTSAGSIQITPNPIALGVTATATNTCGPACGAGSGNWYIDGVMAGGFTYTSGETIVALIYPSAGLTVGQHLIQFNYSGDATHPPLSSDTVSFGVVANDLPVPKVTASITPNPLPAGEWGLATITSNCASACGDGYIYVDGVYAGAYVLDGSGTAQAYIRPTLGLSIATHTFTFDYFGSPTYSDVSSSPMSFQVVVDPPSPTLTLSVPNPTISVGTLGTVNVSSNCAGTCDTGSAITFSGFIFVDGTQAGSFTLDNTGSASTSVNYSMTPGQHSITASFFGGTTWGPLTATPPLTVNVLGK